MRCAPALVLLSWLLLANACAVDAAPEAATGSLALALRSTAQDGQVYRLRNALLQITGASELNLEASEGEEVLQTDLAAGDYRLALRDGWQLEREQAGGWEAVSATLRSDNPQSFAIAAGETTQLTLRFAIAGAEPVALGTGQLEVGLGLEPAAAAGDDCAAGLVINELDSDQDGADEREYVELFNAGACAATTDGLSLVLRNGGAAGAPVYAEIALAPAAAQIAGGMYLVVGAPSVIAELAPGALAVSVDGFSVQNGPDAVELRRDGEVLDAVAYGGAVAGAGEGVAAAADRGAGSLDRCPNGGDTDDNAGDFELLGSGSPGGVNSCAGP